MESEDSRRNYWRTGGAKTAEVDDYLAGSESHLEDGASVPSLRQRGKLNGTGAPKALYFCIFFYLIKKKKKKKKKNRGKQREKANTPHDNGDPGNRKMKDVMGTEIIKTGIWEYNMTGILTDERRYGNLNTTEWNDKNFMRSSGETGKMKIGNLTIDVYNMNEITGSKLRK